ncbi:flagellar hook-basal body complex protein [Chitinispirillales bacterium ANBcel5]|uniref:flagellar hook-basal body complex protein n=1 Tax=Cellulosispirillum alkaliphilum TaxID=3039283 RepID=UPI002A53BA37|nr:flagellar hook-basal body complex protein [Chitinispirillales bacterium ANBcel5]
MVRSLYSSISGLRNNQVALDVTGNNIANVNTVGFKAGRITFKESMSQLLQGATRPAGNAGGTNPLQIGLGMSIGSIDSMLTQGNLQSTGQITDLALEGRAYFAYSSGEGMFYSRNGALQFDGTGRLVSPTNGFTLQGMMADSNGVYPPGGKIGDIRIPYGDKAPAKETTTVNFASNLESDSQGLGTVTHTNRFIARAEENHTLTSLFDEDGNSLGIRDGDVLTIAVAGETPQRFHVNEVSTLSDLRDEVLAYLREQVSDFINVDIVDGALTIDVEGGAAINGLQITNSRPGSNSQVSNTFSFPPTIESGQVVSSSGIRTPATRDHLLEEVFDAAGQPLGLENGDSIDINGSVAGSAISTNTGIYSLDPADPETITTLGDLMNLIQESFRLPPTDGTTDNNPSVSINEADSDNDRIPDGAIVIRGQPESAFEITSISISATDSNNEPPSPTRFNANMGFTEIQRARDTGVHSTSIEVYDRSGDAHTLTMSFTHSGNPGEWLWEVEMEGGQEILAGSRGRMTFGQDGSPSSFTYDDSATAFRFDPNNGSNVVSINLNVGSPGSFEGITQFRAPSTTMARDQDGYPMGRLQEVSIDESGEITGIYTNGVNKSIAQIYVAEFNNPAGLMRVSDSMLATSNNSGEAVMQKPGVGSSTKIKPGALEMSNVELATEFTNMITTQRGYQANARVITTSDSLLQELVQLVR